MNWIFGYPLRPGISPCRRQIRHGAGFTRAARKILHAAQAHGQSGHSASEMSKKVEKRNFARNKASIPAGAIMPLFFVRIRPTRGEPIFSKRTALHSRPPHAASMPSITSNALPDAPKPQSAGQTQDLQSHRQTSRLSSSVYMASRAFAAPSPV
jgi:hypothetical protein